MVGAFDQVVSIAVPPLALPGAVTVTAIVTVAPCTLFPLPSSPVVSPETPPPIVV